jgi:hypothetical protein
MTTSNYIIIDGTTFNIPVKSCARTFDFLYKYADRTEDGVLHSELIGVYKNYKLEFGDTVDTDEYEALIDKLSEPVEFHTVVVPSEGGDFTYTAYFSNVTDVLRRIHNNKTYWKSLTVNFIAQKPARS